MALIAQTKSCPVLKSGSCATMERNIGEASLQGCFMHMYWTYIVSDKRTYTNNGTRVANNIIAERERALYALYREEEIEKEEDSRGCSMRPEEEEESGEERRE